MHRSFHDTNQFVWDTAYKTSKTTTATRGLWYLALWASIRKIVSWQSPTETLSNDSAQCGIVLFASSSGQTISDGAEEVRSIGNESLGKQRASTRLYSLSYPSSRMFVFSVPRKLDSNRFSWIKLFQAQTLCGAPPRLRMCSHISCLIFSKFPSRHDCI